MAKRLPVPRWLAPALIILLALVLRLLRLGDANLWWDEALAIWAVRKGLLGATAWTAGDVHPPLYFWSLWAWVRLFGESEFAMRSLSVVFGVLAVALVYVLGVLVAERRVGELAALFTALARFHVWWSQEMRMYILAGLLGMLALYFFLRWLRAERPGSPEAHGRLGPNALLALYALCAIGSLYTIFLMAALLLVQNLIVLLLLIWPRVYDRKCLFCKWVVAQVTILAALAPWMILSWGRMKTWSVAAPMGLRALARLYATLLTTGVSVDIGRYTWPVLLPFVVLLLGLYCLLAGWRRQGRVEGMALLDVLTLTFSCSLTAGVVYLASLPRGLFYTPHIEARYFVPFAPPFWLLLAWAVVLIARRWRLAGWLSGLALVVLLALFLPGHYHDRYLNDELQTMARTIVSQAHEGDAVLLDSGGRYPVFLYYYDRFPAGVWRPPMVTLSRAEEPLTVEQVERSLSQLDVEHERIWLAEVDVNLSDPERLVGHWLEERYPVVSIQRYGPNALYLYDPAGTLATLQNASYEPQHVLNVQVGDDGLLAGWELPVERVPPGESIYLSLLWKRAPRGPTVVALRNARGQVLLRRQGEVMPGAAARQQFDFPVFASTPAGRYDLVLFPGSDDEVTLGALRIAGTTPLPKVARQHTSLQARLGDDILLVGYRLRGGHGDDPQLVGPGDTLVLDLYWQAEGKLARDYTVFTHLLGQAYNPRTQGPVWGQHDSQPADGGYPTTQWFVGDTVVDRHIIRVDPGAPAGEYRLQVGMYTWEDGQRLPITAPDGQAIGDHLRLETSVLQVVGAQ